MHQWLRNIRKSLIDQTILVAAWPAARAHAGLRLRLAFERRGRAARARRQRANRVEGRTRQDAKAGADRRARAVCPRISVTAPAIRGSPTHGEPSDPSLPDDTTIERIRQRRPSDLAEDVLAALEELVESQAHRDHPTVPSGSADGPRTTSPSEACFVEPSRTYHQRALAGGIEERAERGDADQAAADHRRRLRAGVPCRSRLARVPVADSWRADEQEIVALAGPRQRLAGDHTSPWGLAATLRACGEGSRPQRRPLTDAIPGTRDAGLGCRARGRSRRCPCGGGVGPGVRRPRGQAGQVRDRWSDHCNRRRGRGVRIAAHDEQLAPGGAEDHKVMAPVSTDPRPDARRASPCCARPPPSYTLALVCRTESRRNGDELS